MANSIVIIAVICYSTLLYIMDYYGIFIVYYDILLYIYILLLKSSLSLCHILAGSQFTGITQYNWVGTTLIQGLQGCLKTTQRSHNSPIANTFCSTVQAPAKFERKVSNLSDAAFGWLCTSSRGDKELNCNYKNFELLELQEIPQRLDFQVNNHQLLNL